RPASTGEIFLAPCWRPVSRKLPEVSALLPVVGLLLLGPGGGSTKAASGRQFSHKTMKVPNTKSKTLSSGVLAQKESFGDGTAAVSPIVARKLAAEVARRSKIEVRAIGESDAGEDDLAV